MEHRCDNGVAVQVSSGSFAKDVDAVVQVRFLDVVGMLHHHLPDIVGIPGAEIEDLAVPLLGGVRASPVDGGSQIGIDQSLKVTIRSCGATDHLLRDDAPLLVCNGLDEVEVQKAGIDSLKLDGLGLDGNHGWHGQTPTMDRVTPDASFL